MRGLQSKRLKVRLAFVALSIMAASFPHATAQTKVAAAPNPVRVAQQFLLGVFPELKGQGLLFTFAARGPLEKPWDLGNEFGVEIRRFPPGQPLVSQEELSQGQLVYEKPILKAGFLCDSNGRITRYYGSIGGLVHGEENERIRQLVDSHPEWSDEQITEVLKDAGVRYGPEKKNALLQAVPIATVQRFLGRISIKSVEFETRLPEGGPSRAVLYWTVNIEAHSPSRGTAHYVLTLEPFGGKLTSIVLWRK